jgi:hypothetical protein
MLGDTNGFDVSGKTGVAPRPHSTFCVQTLQQAIMQPGQCADAHASALFLSLHKDLSVDK